jgi:hypothetical protein
MKENNFSFITAAVTSKGKIRLMQPQLKKIQHVWLHKIKDLFQLNQNQALNPVSIFIVLYLHLFARMT